MSLHVDERPDGGFAFFIDGDLQFDTQDEALYHEGLALPALCAATDRHRTRPDGIRVLICGGGDGLALRECLRFPGVAHVDLVDCDPAVVELGRTRFAALNGRAFEDSRVAVHIADARDYLAGAAAIGRPPYDAIICDFTVPRKPEDAAVFSVEWYARVGAALKDGGTAALNALSPQATPEAFACIVRTVKAAGLWPVPYRICIPSFRAQGYGAWGFVAAGKRRLRQPDLFTGDCPVATRQCDLARMRRGARFSRVERALMAAAPVHRAGESTLFDLMLNPGRLVSTESVPAASVLREAAAADGAQYDLEPLLRAVPIVHPYHTREMVETLAEQVAGAVRALDIRRLVSALLERAARLPRDLVTELRRLRSYLAEHAPTMDELAAAASRWGARLFATLVIVMTIANAIAPDNAFAKGSFGLGHASMSRGYAAGEGSFGRGGAFGTSSPTISHSASEPLTGGGFRSGYRSGEITDIYGNSYRSRSFYYCGSGYGHFHTYYSGYGQSAPAGEQPVQQTAVFAADDDMLVMDNGDVVITLSDTAYLLVTNGTVALFSNKSPNPLLPVYPDPRLFDAIRAQLQGQQEQVARDIEPRRDWLSWVGWTSTMFPVVRDDRREVRNLADLQRRLGLAATRVGAAPAAATAAAAQGVEIFIGCYARGDGEIAIRTPDDRWLYTDGTTIGDEIYGPAYPAGRHTSRPCPKLLATTLKGVMDKLQKELAADMASDENDLRQLEQDNASLQNDLAQYNQIYQQNGWDPSYEVDYGTEEISVGDAITRTQRDIQQNESDTQATMADRTKSAAEMQRLADALARFESPASGGGGTPAKK